LDDTHFAMVNWPEDKKLLGFAPIFVFFPPSYFYLNFLHFKQIISKKINILKNNLITAKPEKLLR
jgi:hypothetical protein